MVVGTRKRAKERRKSSRVRIAACWAEEGAFVRVECQRESNEGGFSWSSVVVIWSSYGCDVAIG